MGTKISVEVLEGYLRCKFKAHLKLAGEQGTKSDYEALLAESRDTVRRAVLDQILSCHPLEAVQCDVALSPSALRRDAEFLLNVTLEADAVTLAFDGLKQVPGSSMLGDYHYIPLLFHGGESVRKEQRRLLELYGLLLGRMQGHTPGHGIVWYGRGCRATKVRLSPDPHKLDRLVRDVQHVREGGVPRLVLNDHCQVCEFRQRCHEQAVREDNLSLLRGVGEKEVRGYGRKGILTLTQLAHTFRPRRKGKRVARRTGHRYHALQALAIRDKRIYVFGRPELPDAPVRVYIDFEGLPDEGFVYLIGMTVVQDESEEHYSFWAESKDQEPVIFEQFLAQVSRYEDAQVFCYGQYERTFLKRMRKAAHRKKPVDRVLTALVNVLSLVYSHLYFPCYSNGLKDIASCLSCSWTEPEASGIQSIAWRKRWETGHANEWRQKLVTYNREDCAALRKVTELISMISCQSSEAKAPRPVGVGGLHVASVEELDRLGVVERRGKIDFFHPDYQYINGCAHFDYQRRRVYARTSKIIKKNRRQRGVHRNRSLRVSRRVQIIGRSCPACGSTQITRWTKGKRGCGCYTRHKKSFDLVFMQGGIRRQVVECRAAVHECGTCGKVFVPERYERVTKHFHGLMSWAMYEHIAHRAAYRTIKELFEEFFGLAVYESEIHYFKSHLARYYRPCYNQLLAKILAGQVLHADETEVKLRTGKGYVWVLTTAEEVVYVYRPTREGDFLPKLLKGFRGVLVSDFYATYDALPCPQQKCLIHLMRDMNQELLNNPFDTELQSITGPFGVLLRAAVEDIDRHGLKRLHLAKHERQVAKFFESLASQLFVSEAAEALRARLLRYRDKLFTFLRYDGVPWNNNNAENAIRRFAYYREGTPGCLKEAGLRDYLVLLSVCQTCRYKGVSFLKFLLYGGRDIDAFCTNPRRKHRRPQVEVYPKGVMRPDMRFLVEEKTDGDMATPTEPPPQSEARTDPFTPSADDSDNLLLGAQ
jgi:predicted RecB family nuclease